MGSNFCSDGLCASNTRHNIMSGRSRGASNKGKGKGMITLNERFGRLMKEGKQRESKPKQSKRKGDDNARANNKSTTKKPKSEPVTQEQLDRELDEFMGRDPDVAAKEALNLDLDEFWGDETATAE